MEGDPRGTSSKRGFLALGVVLLALATATAVALLTREDSEDQADGNVPGTTVPTTPVDTRREQFTRAVADGILRGGQGSIDQGEADCMAEALVDELGVERLAELGVEAAASRDPSNPLAGLTAEEQSVAIAVMVPCADAETRARLDPPG